MLARSTGCLEAPAYFSPIEKNHALDTPLYREDVLVPKERLQKALLSGALTDVYFPGFPTFKHLKYTVSFLTLIEILSMLYFGLQNLTL